VAKVKELLTMGALVAGVAVLSACAAVASPSGSSRAVTPDTAPPKTMATVPLQNDPRSGDEIVAACSVAAAIRLPTWVLDGPRLDREEFVATDAGRAVEAFFDGGPGEGEDFVFGPADGFTMLDDSMVFAYRNGVLMGTIELRGSEVVGWGGCHPVRVRDDLVAMRWRPATAPEPSSRELDLVVDGGGCVTDGGVDVLSELADVEVTETAEAVTITTFTRERPFEGHCADVGVALDAHVTLDAPLGDRVLLDGGLIPPSPPDT